MKTLQDRSREQAATSEYMKLYNEVATEGMSGRQSCPAESALRNEYILYAVNGIGQWRPEFAQFTPVSA